MQPEEIRDGLCGICPAGCWVRIGLTGGRIQEVEALPDHPLGMICTIGRHSPQIVYDPKRLRSPLRRVGPKGGYHFEPISWDEALDTVAERLERIKAESGPEATAIYTGRGSFDMALCDLFQPDGVAISSASSLLFPFGSPNTLGVGALCYVSFAMIAPHVTLGEMYMTMETEIEQAELVVVWGANPATDSPPLTHRRILEARAHGAQVVVIDPRRHETAREAEAEWIPIRPGTDGALALGMIEVLLEEELFDEETATHWSVGLEELRRLAQHYRPDVVERITGVPAATVVTLARRIAGARGACPVMYTGLEYSDSGVQAIRAVLVLWALAGQLDVPGGLVIRMRENAFPQNRSRLVANPDMRKALGRDRFPVYSHYRGESHAIALPRSVLEGQPYRIRGLMVLGGSIITAWPNPELWRRTLAALDFLVVIDRYQTADSAYADLVLPACTMYEATSYMRYGPLFKIRERVIEPVGEARSDIWILAELARRLGYGHLYPRSEEEAVRFALEPVGLSLEEVRAAGGEARVPAAVQQYRKWVKGLLRADGKPGFETPSGKIEIASSILAEHGYEPLPVYVEPGEGPLERPDIAADFPLVLNTGARTAYDFRSQHHGVRSLGALAPEPVVTMNTDDAAERGIRDGDRVVVESPRGRVAYRARVTGDIVRGTVDAAMGGGGPLGPKAWRDCNVNELTDVERYDPISGFPVYKTLLCDVRLAEERTTAQAQPAAVREAETRRGSAVVAGAPDHALASDGGESAQATATHGSGTEPRDASSASYRPADVGGGDETAQEPARESLRASGATSRPADAGDGSAGASPTATTIRRPAAGAARRPRREVYLDHNATTPVSREVLAAMMPYFTEDCGNPASIHQRGGRAHTAVEAARRQIAQTLNCTARRIVFTSGGSEADNLAIKGATARLSARGRHVVTSAIEHPAVLETCRSLVAAGYELTVLPVDEQGRVSPAELEHALRPDTVLVSIMLANNVVGTLQPVRELVEVAREHGVLFHTDAVQALGKLAVDVQELGIDMLSLSAHKLYGPKGVGALFVRQGIELEPLVHGGGQERGLRSGTLNVAGIVGFGKACELAERRLHDGEEQRLAELRDRLAAGIAELIPDARRNGSVEHALANTLSMTLPGIRGESMVLLLDRRGVYLSSGSACKSGHPDPSHALLAMGLSTEAAHCAVRFSLGAATTDEDVKYTLTCLRDILREEAGAVRFVGCR